VLTINGFLFAALGVTLPKLIEEAARMPAANVGEVRIYFLFVVSLCLVGFIVSLAAHLALNAAYVATAAIKGICDKTYASEKMAVRGQTYEVFHTDEGVLPMVTRGGAQTRGGSSFIVRYGCPTCSWRSGWPSVFWPRSSLHDLRRGQFFGNSSPISR
jgi:hypothetical protein